MKYLATLALTLASVATADWTLYCGDSCADATEVATGTVAKQYCNSLGDTYDYCYMIADEVYGTIDWWKVIFYESTTCLLDGDQNAEYRQDDLFNGTCSFSASWTSYEITVNA